MSRVLVLDSATPWIRNLFTALPSDWKAEFLGPRTIGLSPREWLGAIRNGSASCNWSPVPGWTRAFSLSTRLFARAVRRRAFGKDPPQMVVHSIPWTAGLIDWFPECPHIYRPHDYFGHYQWDQRKVAELEVRMQRGCSLTIPLTELHANDLRNLGPAPVHSLGCGVSTEFIRRLRGPIPTRPGDLPSDGKPIVGCTGQINLSYDFDLIAGLADATPNAWFVFIGPIFDEGAEARQMIDSTFSRPNIYWLGPRPHERLPDYLSHFTVCINPMGVSPSNHRRSQLRLFDYLAADKPILSAPLVDAQHHGSHIVFGESIEDFASHLRMMLDGGYTVDIEERHRYVDAQSWETRGARFVELAQEFCTGARTS